MTISVVRLNDGTFGVMEDEEITYGGGLSYEEARRIAASHEVVERQEPSDETDVHADIGYRRR